VSLIRGFALLILVGFAGPASGAAPGPAGRPGVERPGFDRRDTREQAILDAIQAADPERHRKILEVRESRPRLYRAVIGQAAMSLRSRDEDVGAVARFGKIVDECHNLHTQLAAWEKASAADQARFRKDIEGTVGRLFDLRQEARRAQVAMIEARLERLRTEISTREAKKKELVDTFTRAMLGAEDDPGF